MSDDFKEGEVVFYWPTQEWVQISRVFSDGSLRIEAREGSLPGISTDEVCRNPVIPPKPKRTVTKECNPDVSTAIVQKYGLAVFRIPDGGAKNIKCTYEVEE